MPLRSVFTDQVEPVADPSPAAWIAPRLLPTSRDEGTPVGAVVPIGFDAYVRLLHPARAADDSTMRWSQVADQHGRVSHGSMLWETITHPANAFRSEAGLERPSQGSMPSELAMTLVGVLRHHTGTGGSCWLAVWDGFGDEPRLDLGLVEHPGRSYVLLRGAIDAAAQPLWRYENFSHVRYQSPNLWWPDDRAWIVGTEIDFAWTYVACTQEAAQALLREERVEAFQVQPNGRADVFGDDVNPLPPDLLERFNRKPQ